MESTSSVPLLWQIIISFGSGIIGITVGGFLNHFLMIRQEHTLRIFNSRIEAFSKFYDNTNLYTKKIFENSRVFSCFFLSPENGAILRGIMLFGSKSVTSRCAHLLISFLSSEPGITDNNGPIESIIVTANNLFQLFTDCMKFDLESTSINLKKKPTGSEAKSLEKNIEEMEKELKRKGLYV